MGSSPGLTIFLVLALLLFVTRIFANYPNDILPPHNFAAFAETFNGGTDFHGDKLVGKIWLGRLAEEGRLIGEGREGYRSGNRSMRNSNAAGPAEER